MSLVISSKQILTLFFSVFSLSLSLLPPILLFVFVVLVLFFSQLFHLSPPPFKYNSTHLTTPLSQRSGRRDNRPRASSSLAPVILLVVQQARWCLVYRSLRQRSSAGHASKHLYTSRVCKISLFRKSAILPSLPSVWLKMTQRRDSYTKGKFT